MNKPIKKKTNMLDATDKLLDDKRTSNKSTRRNKPQQNKNRRGKISHIDRKTSTKRNITKPQSKQQQKNQPKIKSAKTNPSALRIIPLGGQEEVGRNMTIYEMEKDIVILDMGLQFPEEDMPGIDYIIPNISYLKGKEKNIRAVIFSHGHLDHIGAAPILLEKLGYPLVVGSDLTLALLKNRVEDYKKGTVKKLKTLTLKNLDKSLPLGKFTAKFFAVEHSIADAVGVILETKEGSIIHPGDWTCLLYTSPSPRDPE